MARKDVTDEELTDLVTRTGRANSALMRGDIGGYLALIRHAEDYTLMAPFGGMPTRPARRRASPCRTPRATT